MAGGRAWRRTRSVAPGRIASFPSKKVADFQAARLLCEHGDFAEHIDPANAAAGTGTRADLGAGLEQLPYLYRSLLCSTVLKF
jgi:hypothetical protein